MKNNTWLITIVSIIIIGFTQWFTPWWISVLLLFLIGLFLITKGRKAFLLGWFVLFTIWICTAIYQNTGSHESIAEGIGKLLGGFPVILVYLMTGIIGGLVGGLSALSGTLIGHLVFKD